MHRSPVLLLILVSALAVSACSAQDGEVTCNRAVAAPDIDGTLDDACWQDAAVVKGFTLPLSDEPVAKPIVARACFDDGQLYLGVTCAEPEPGKLQLAQVPGGEVWQDDCIEIWLRAGTNQLNFDQFIVNAKGHQQAVRHRPGGAADDPLEWSAAGEIGTDSWTVEAAIPFAEIGLEAPKPGEMLQLKIGREDYVSGSPALSTWPPKSRYAGAEGFGRLYFETANLLSNPDMAEQQDGLPVDWHFGENDAALFSSVDDGGHAVIRFDAPGRYSTGQHNLQLKPNAAYRLSARVKGEATVYLRSRTAKRAGETTTAYTVNSRPGEEYQDLEVTFPTGETGSALLIIGNTESQGIGEVLIADLRVSEEVAFEADGPAIALASGEITTVKKVPVTDCRALRGFVVAPVDGRLDSYSWNMSPWEYGMGGAGAGVGYHYKDNDGLHVTLADSEGVDAVIIRNGAKVKLYQGADAYDDPGAAPLVHEFKGRAKTSRVVFPERVSGDRFSFFEIEDGLIADVQFLRVSSQAGSPSWTFGLADGAAEPPPDARAQLDRRFGEDDRTVHPMSPAPSFDAPAKQTVHLMGRPPEDGLALDSVFVSLNLAGAPTSCPLTVAVQDPLNPRGELMSADLTIEDPNTVSVVMDFPDQIVGPLDTLWVSLTFGARVTVTEATIGLRTTDTEPATAEALAYRKLLMKGIFCELSEARQWGTFKGEDIKLWAETNDWGRGVVDLAETIAHARALGPDDDTVRCYDEWFWRRVRDLEPFEPTIDDAPGAPEWAVLARQAWLQVRDVAKWWMDNRLVPTGELGGLVGDDSDWYQNFIDLRFFENDGVAAQLGEANRALAEMAELENLEAGLNRRTMDPLHAYEEGVNQEALMTYWFYGDPVYFERCLLAAKSAPGLTTVTDLGHRHFTNQDCGAEDLRIDRELGVDGHAHPLMFHPSFEVAWYNGSPKVVEYLTEWADGWLEHQVPGEYATSVDVAKEEATATSQRALYGGYGGQGSAHRFLYRLTDDLRFIAPYFDFWNRDEDTWPARRFVPELWQSGALDGVAEKDGVLRGNPLTAALALGDRAAIIDALKANIAELQRFGTMYTDADVFTDRVFMSDVMDYVAQVYTGGFATRNKYDHTHAVSWGGLWDGLRGVRAARGRG